MQKRERRSGTPSVDNTRLPTGHVVARELRSLAASLLALVCRRHNHIQFFGYEAANLLLIWDKRGEEGVALGGLSYEALAALAFLVGSASIYASHPERWPAGLFHGGIALTIGGVFLLLAGYPLTGFAVALASLETVRGGLGALAGDLARTGRTQPPFTGMTLAAAKVAFGFYLVPVDALCRRFGGFGRFLNERPFLTSALIKLPMRLEFVVKNLLQGDVIGAVVGLSWMIFGDGALAFNDRKLCATSLRWCETVKAGIAGMPVQPTKPAH